MQSENEDFLQRRDYTLEQLHASVQHIAEDPKSKLFIEWLLHITGVTHLHPVRDQEDRLRKEGKRQLGFAVAEFMALDDMQIQERIIRRIQQSERMKADRSATYNTNE